MKRCLLALALLGIIAGLAHAHFVVIRVNLGVPPDPPKKDPMNPMNPMNPGVIPPGGIGYGKKMPGPGPGPGPGQVAKEQQATDTPLTIVVVVEYEKIGKVQRDLTTFRPYIGHKWSGKQQGNMLPTYLWSDDKVVQLTFRQHQSLAQQAKNRRDDFNKKRDKSPKDYLDCASWALANGLLDDKDVGFKHYMAELEKTEVKDQPAADILKAYKQVRDAMAKRPSRDDAAIVWKSRYSLKSVPSDHYVLLYDAQTNSAPPEVNSRLDRLEKNYQEFFYWFALRGKALPVPDYRLVGFLVDSPADFRQYHSAFDSPSMAADGFFSRRDNLMVLTTERLDEPSIIFNSHLKSLFQTGWNPKQLLQGLRPRALAGAGGAAVLVDPNDADYAQTMVLVQKVLQEEAEAASISHEGTRQLLAATGPDALTPFLPRTVALPEWLQYGLPSVWDTSKYDPVLRSGAYWYGFGLPNWNHVVQYKVLEADKQIEAGEMPALLQAVLTDYDFRLAAQNPRNPEMIARARTMSWALCHFLVHRHLDGLERFSKELGALPRDLEFDRSVTLNCFARAFKLTDAKNQLDDGKFRNFAKEWKAYMEIVQPPMREQVEEGQKAYKEFKEKQAAALKAPMIP
jgi:hypothetical protein